MTDPILRNIARSVPYVIMLGVTPVNVRVMFIDVGALAVMRVAVAMDMGVITVRIRATRIVRSLVSLCTIVVFIVVMMAMTMSVFSLARISITLKDTEEPVRI